MPERKLKTFAERIGPVIDRFRPIMNDLVKIDSERFFAANYWAPLKLYCFAAYIHGCYVPIISKNPKIRRYIGDNFYFVDLLSNSGINMVCKHKDCDPEENRERCEKCKRKGGYLVGSALIAATAEPPFKKMYFIDINPKNLTVLRKRLEFLTQKGMCKSRFETKEGDCNVVIDEIIRQIKTGGGYHFLAIIDNEGLNADWSTIEKLLDCHCDLIINFPTSSVRRNFHNENAIRRFLGCENLSEARDDPLGYYVKKIKAKNKTVETISVKTGLPFHYDLIIVTKPDASFSDVIRHIKKSTEENTAKEAERAFDFFFGGQKRLDA